MQVGPPSAFSGPRCHRYSYYQCMINILSDACELCNTFQGIPGDHFPFSRGCLHANDTADMEGLYDELRAEERRQITRPAPVRNERLLSIEKLDWEARFPPKQKTLRGRTIQKVVISNSTLVIAANGNSILRWKLNGKDFDEVELPCKADDAVEQLFLDPSANHLLIGMKSGD
eukprot:gene13056-15060_t